jgi:hypothetical protein
LQKRLQPEIPTRSSASVISAESSSNFVAKTAHDSIFHDSLSAESGATADRDERVVSVLRSARIFTLAGHSISISESSFPTPADLELCFCHSNRSSWQIRSASILIEALLSLGYRVLPLRLRATSYGLQPFCMTQDNLYEIAQIAGVNGGDGAPITNKIVGKLLVSLFGNDFLSTTRIQKYPFVHVPSA